MLHLVLTLAIDVLTLVNIGIFALIFLSWIPILPPWHPVIKWLRLIIEPLLKPFRRALPLMGGLDFSPLVAIIVIDNLRNLLANIDVSGGLQSADIPTIIVGTITRIFASIFLLLTLLVGVRMALELFKADRFHPLTMGIYQITNPLIQPFSRFTRGNPETTPIVALAAYLIAYILFTHIPIG